MNLARSSRSARQSAFTLIELVISGSLMAIIMVSAYVCLSACLESQKVIEPRVEIFQNARVALSLISADLRSACVLSSDAEFVGMRRTLGEIPADNLDFATHHYTPKRPREGDYCQVSYFVDRDRETGQYALFRRRNPTIGLDPFSGGSREVIATGIVGVRFEYYDGLDWYDDWGDPDAKRKQQFSQRERTNLSGLPEAVRVTIMFDTAPRGKKSEALDPATAEKEEPPPPLVFQTVARLNLAAAATQSSSSSSSSSTTESGNTQPTPVPEGGGN
jgi:type II secretory pathway component PulJ